MQQKLEKILKCATDDEKEEIEILRSALSDTAGKYKKKSSVSNKKNWDAARKGLDEIIERLWQKYFHQEPAFPTLLAALRWLQKEDYKIKRQKIYDDRKKGFFAMQADGKSVTHAEIRAYAATYLKKVESKTRDLSELHEKEKNEIIAKTKIQKEKLQFELDVARGKYVPVKDVAMELATRAGIFEAGLKHLFQTRGTDIIYMVAGDPKKAHVLITTIHGWLDELLNEYATVDEFQVLFEKIES